MNKKQVSVFSTIANVFLAILKVAMGLITNSQAILASGIDSTSDILSSFLVFVGIKFSEKESSKKYPYGFYRVESITSFIVFLIVLVASVGVIFNSASSIINKDFSTNIGTLALGSMIFSGIVTSVQAFLKISVGKKEGSTSLVLDGKHSLMDVLSTLGAIIGLLLTKINPHF